MATGYTHALAEGEETASQYLGRYKTSFIVGYFGVDHYRDQARHDKETLSEYRKKLEDFLTLSDAELVGQYNRDISIVSESRIASAQRRLEKAARYDTALSVLKNLLDEMGEDSYLESAILHLRESRDHDCRSDMYEDYEPPTFLEWRNNREESLRRMVRSYEKSLQTARDNLREAIRFRELWENYVVRARQLEGS